MYEHQIVSTNRSEIITHNIRGITKRNAVNGILHTGKYLGYNIIYKPLGGFCSISCCLYVIVRIVPCANCALEKLFFLVYVTSCPQLHLNH
ncbi:unnamed protein product [Acanthoscelides obtectus]|uniref:Uncharacterized protein n=1 Tax=Acanthoscelides obtectus TaxID=200917 RepID=A0A9P0KFZ0_ACAOB|nr:unnamed protein product [Acanthoscelides obtectus]CAK1626321.1 hypothetical protein AOBTE_LOCUS3776 [Acanthoscelides obtectus]